jgi:hypothetical protein
MGKAETDQVELNSSRIDDSHLPDFDDAVKNLIEQRLKTSSLKSSLDDYRDFTFKLVELNLIEDNDFNDLENASVYLYLCDTFVINIERGQVLYHFEQLSENGQPSLIAAEIEFRKRVTDAFLKIGWGRPDNNDIKQLKESVNQRVIKFHKNLMKEMKIIFDQDRSAAKKNLKELYQSKLAEYDQALASI